MTIFDLSQLGLAPEPMKIRRPPIDAAVNIKGGQQQVPHLWHLPIGAGPGSLDWGNGPERATTTTRPSKNQSWADTCDSTGRPRCRGDPACCTGYDFPNRRGFQAVAC